MYLALDHDLDVMPVINKIDLPSADPDRVVEEIEDVIGIEAQDAPRISAKTGLNVEDVLEQIVEKIPAPQGDPDAPLQALIFDSLYDSYKGVIVFCRIKEGSVRVGTCLLYTSNFNRSITMYRKLLDEKQGNGYILEDVSKAGYSTIMLWVFVDNVRAIEFYKKYGFMASGKEKTTFGAVEEIYMKEL